jgi:hypothetical protein
LGGRNSRAGPALENSIYLFLYAAGAAEFAIDGFTTFSPFVKMGERTRVMILIKTDVAVKTNARLSSEFMTD